MRKAIAGTSLILSLSLLCSCRTTLQEAAAAAHNVTAVVFVKRDGGNAHIIRSVNEPEGVRRIVGGIRLGKERPASRRPFARHVVFLQGKKEYFTLSFDRDYLRDAYLLRCGAKEYETTRETYELLAAYFEG